MCCEAVQKLFKQDKLGCASLGVVKVISGLVKGRSYNVRPEVRVFMLYCTIFFCQWFKKYLKVRSSAAARYGQAEFRRSARTQRKIRNGLSQKGLEREIWGRGKNTGRKRADPSRDMD